MDSSKSKFQQIEQDLDGILIPGEGIDIDGTASSYSPPHSSRERTEKVIENNNSNNGNTNATINANASCTIARMNSTASDTWAEVEDFI